MNLTFLKYNFVEEMKKYKFNWSEILFALDNSIITSEDVITYSMYVLDNNIENFDTVLEIGILEKNEEVRPLLIGLIEPCQIAQDTIKDKWLYLILKWLYENQNICLDALSVVEDIYEKFDYPREIESFVRYLPCEEPNLGSLELNRNRMFKKWKEYLTRYEEEDLE